MASGFETASPAQRAHVSTAHTPRTSVAVVMTGKADLRAWTALADGGKLIFPKLAHGGVTVAFSKVTFELSFKER